MAIEVRVLKRSGRAYWQAVWTDPVTGLERTASTKATKKKDADRFALKLERDLNEGVYRYGPAVTWKDFRTRHETEVQGDLAKKTRDKYAAIFGHVERIIRPKKLAAVDATQISKLQLALRDTRTYKLPDGTEVTEAPLEPITVRTSLIYLRAALRWAKGMGMLQVLPEITLPKRVATPKGRSITAEEYERMLAAVPDVVGRSPRFKNDPQRRDARVAAWRHLLTGLWWSGLRLNEALDLHWTSDRRMRVDFSGRRPMFVMRPEADKAFRDRLFPLAPEFAAFLDATPQRQRRGFVFEPMTEIDYGRRMRLDSTSKVIDKIGRKAGVRVSVEGRAAKFASAHDLRRAFGFRWAMRVMPAVLKELMRHEDVATTMQFYVGHEAEAVADVIWGLTDTFTDTRAISPAPRDAVLP